VSFQNKQNYNPGLIVLTLYLFIGTFIKINRAASHFLGGKNGKINGKIEK